MAPLSRLGRQIAQVTEALRRIEAVELRTSLGDLRVISPEGLVGFKLRGLANDPRRTQDLEDIRALLRANRSRLDMAKVREYFQIFDRDSLLDELLRDTA